MENGEKIDRQRQQQSSNSHDGALKKEETGVDSIL